MYPSFVSPQILNLHDYDWQSFYDIIYDQDKPRLVLFHSNRWPSHESNFRDIVKQITDLPGWSEKLYFGIVDCGSNQNIKVKVCAPHICHYSNGSRSCKLTYPQYRVFNKYEENSRLNKEKIRLNRVEKLDLEFLSQILKNNYAADELTQVKNLVGGTSSSNQFYTPPEKPNVQVQQPDNQRSNSREANETRNNNNNRQQNSVQSKNNQENWYPNYGITSYTDHVWLIQGESGENLALFWMEKENCQDWKLSITKNGPSLKVQYKTERCVFKPNDYGGVFVKLEFDIFARPQKSRKTLTKNPLLAIKNRLL